MKKDELIKKAAERGITIDETQAEKYINLSDEELENLEISGGCGTPEKPPTFGEMLYNNTAVAVNDPDTAATICGEWSEYTFEITFTRNCWSCLHRANYRPGGIACTNTTLVQKVLIAKHV